MPFIMLIFWARNDPYSCVTHKRTHTPRINHRLNAFYRYTWTAGVFLFSTT